MLSGYSDHIQRLLKSKSIGVGQRVVIEQGGERYEGFLMPARSPDHLVIKLDNGYNIGIHFTEGTTITKKSEFREPKKADVRLEKHRPDAGKPTLALISTGGTVASRIDYKTGAVTTAFSVEELYAAVPELKEIANIRVRQLFQLFSQDMEAEHWISLAKAVKEEIETGADGVIVMQGTDVIPYSSAALSLMLRNLPVPVLFVGSQRSSDRGSSDTFFNMICATHAATKSDYAGVGICMHGTSDDEYCFVLDGVNVRKMHTSRRDTFRPIDVLPIAQVWPNGHMEYLRHDYQKRGQRMIRDDIVFNKHVAILKSRPGFSWRELEMYEHAGFRGLVIEGTGLGHLPNESHDQHTQDHEKINETIRRLTKAGMVIVMTSQCPYGRVNLDVYSPQRVLVEAGVLPLRATTETAFVKLGWALGQTTQPETVKEILVRNYVGELVERVEPETFLY